MNSRTRLCATLGAFTVCAARVATAQTLTPAAGSTAKPFIATVTASTPKGR